jgi:hypothetical protein
MAIRFRQRREAHNEILGTYEFPNRTVRVLKTEADRILWTCDCEQFRRQSSQREPLRRAARSSASRVAWPWDADRSVSGSPQGFALACRAASAAAAGWRNLAAPARRLTPRSVRCGSRSG